MNVSEISFDFNRSKNIDIYIDGKNLQEMLDIDKAGVKTDSPINFPNGRTLLTLSSILDGSQIPIDLPSQIKPVYICKECGDYGCGVLGWHIDINDSFVIWRNFQWDDNIHPSDGSDAEEYADHKLAFNKKQYFEAVESLRKLEIL